jgi:hypothetical protein
MTEAGATQLVGAIRSHSKRLMSVRPELSSRPGALEARNHHKWEGMRGVVARTPIGAVFSMRKADAVSASVAAPVARFRNCGTRAIRFGARGNGRSPGGFSAALPL